MTNTITVFRRFDGFDEALTFALSVRGECAFLQVIHSPEREPRGNDMPPLGPWVVDSEGGMIRTWETVCATFERGERARIDRNHVAAIQANGQTRHTR